jgi:hypothetical protein
MLRNKDGSPFILNNPNPLVKNQASENLILYNFIWDYLDEEQSKILHQKIEHTPIIHSEEPEKEPEPVQIPEPKEIIIKTTLKEEKKLQNTILVYCLPKTASSYGEKFTFEGVFVRREDFSIVLWTPIKLELLSIIYPSRYIDGDIPFGDFQWWKVKEIQEKKQGYLVTAIISEIQPDFS